MANEIEEDVQMQLTEKKTKEEYITRLHELNEKYKELGLEINKLLDKFQYDFPEYFKNETL
jgi:hypothetical protein